jgi:hypothetical protein
MILLECALTLARDLAYVRPRSPSITKICNFVCKKVGITREWESRDAAIPPPPEA